MGDWRNLKWMVVWSSMLLAGSAGAQTGGYPADPRGASKGAPYQYPQQSYPAQNSGYYDQQQPAPARPVAPQQPQQAQRPQQSQQSQQSQQPSGYSARPTQYQQSRPRAQTYVLAPPLLPYYEGAEPPEGYVLQSHRNHGLMIGGALTWTAAYATGLLYAAGKNFDNGTNWLAAPLIGPWGAIANREFRCKSSQNVTQKEIDKCVDGALGEVTSITFLAMLGMTQTVGVVLFFVGVGDTTEEWLRADLADVKLSPDAGPVGDSGYGFVLNGAF